ncbi:MAG TPA: hypothetical protein VF989_16810 [Polyangiaceae bacterium]
MEKRPKWTPGQEVALEDLDVLSRLSGLSLDRELAGLLRVRPHVATPAQGLVVEKAILRPTFAQSTGATSPDHTQAPAAIVGGGGGFARIAPLRAIVGPRATLLAIGGLLGHYDVRSATFLDETSAAVVDLSLAATTDHRWDLIYAKLDVDQDVDTEGRYIKSGPVDENVSQQNVATRTRSLLSFAVVQGTPAASPNRPALPSDTASSYFIPLAYVRLVHPWAGSDFQDLPDEWIQEVAPVLPIHEAMGVTNLAPVDGCYKVSGFTNTVYGWGPADVRPPTYLPPEMVGGFQRFIPLICGGSNRTVPLGGTRLLDESVKYQNRLFKCTVFEQVHFTATKFGFSFRDSGDNLISPEPGRPCLTIMGQSFSNDWESTMLAFGSGKPILTINEENAGLPANAAVTLFVDSSNNLVAECSSTDPDRILLMWLEASGQWARPAIEQV